MPECTIVSDIGKTISQFRLLEKLRADAAEFSRTTAFSEAIPHPYLSRMKPEKQDYRKLATPRNSSLGMWIAS